MHLFRPLFIWLSDSPKPIFCSFEMSGFGQFLHWDELQSFNITNDICESSSNSKLEIKVWVLQLKNWKNKKVPFEFFRYIQHIYRCQIMVDILYVVF